MELKGFVQSVETLPPEKEGGSVRYAATLAVLLDPTEYKRFVGGQGVDGSVSLLLQKTQ